MKTIFETDDPQFYGYIFLFLGIFIRYHIGKRRFYRRGVGGLQHYRSFPVAIVTTILEWLANLVALAMILCSMYLLIKW